MLDQGVSRLFAELYETALYDRRRGVKLAARNIKERMSARGVLLSGMTVGELRDLYVGELRARSMLAWEELQGVLSQLGVVPNDSAVTELSSILATVLDAQYAELTSALANDTVTKQMNVPVSLEDDLANLKRELRARVELRVRSLERQAIATAGQVFNFHAHVGAVQTGPNASAHIAFNLSPSAAEQLRLALSDVTTALAAAKDIDPSFREEVSAVAAEVRQELTEAKPNRLRVSQLATGVATAIQTTASLQPAYKALKMALNAIGITLP